MTKEEAAALVAWVERHWPKSQWEKGHFRALKAAFEPLDRAQGEAILQHHLTERSTTPHLPTLVQKCREAATKAVVEHHKAKPIDRPEPHSPIELAAAERLSEACLWGIYNGLSDRVAIIRAAWPSPIQAVKDGATTHRDAELSAAELVASVAKLAKAKRNGEPQAVWGAPGLELEHELERNVRNMGGWYRALTAGQKSVIDAIKMPEGIR